MRFQATQSRRDLQFSFQEAIDFAIINNRSVKNAERDIAAAEKKKWETIATGLPQIDGNINYQNFLKQQVQVIPGDFVGGNPGDFVPGDFWNQQNANVSATLKSTYF